MKFAILILCLLTAPALASDKLDKFLAVKSLSASFVQTNHYLGLEEFKRKGNVYIQRPDIALWDYPDDPQEYYLLKPKVIEHYSAELEQLARLKINKAANDDAATVILGIFLDGSDINTRFDIIEAGDNVTLTPKGKLGVQKVVLTFKNDLPQRVFSVDEIGNTVQIDFSEMLTSKPLNENVFKKEPPKGTSIYEQ